MGTTRRSCCRTCRATSSRARSSRSARRPRGAAPATGSPCRSAAPAASASRAAPARRRSASATCSRASRTGARSPSSSRSRCADLNLVRLPDALGDVAAAALGCRFATAYRAVAAGQARVAAGEWVAVHGCGGVGLSAVMIAVAAGARVVAVDVDPARSSGRASWAPTQWSTPRAVPRRRVDADRRRRPRRRSTRSAPRRRSPRSVRGLRRRGRHVQVGLLLGDERPRRADGARDRARADAARRPRDGRAPLPGAARAVASGALDPGRARRRARWRSTTSARSSPRWATSRRAGSASSTASTRPHGRSRARTGDLLLVRQAL